MNTINMCDVSTHRMQMWKYFLDIEHTLKREFNINKVQDNNYKHSIMFQQFVTTTGYTIQIKVSYLDNATIHIDLWGKNTGYINRFVNVASGTKAKNYVFNIEKVDTEFITELINLMLGIGWFPYFEPTNLLEE